MEVGIAITVLRHGWSGVSGASAALEEVKKVLKLGERCTVIPAGKKFGDAGIIACKHLDIPDHFIDMVVAVHLSKLSVGCGEFGERRSKVCSPNCCVGTCNRVFELNDRDSMRSGDIGRAVVSDKISDLDRTGSQLLLV